MTTSSVTSNNAGFVAYMSELGGRFKTGAKNLGSTIAELASTVGRATRKFFVDTLPTWFGSVRTGLSSAFSQIQTLPKETKILGGIAFVVATVAGFIVGKCCCAGQEIEPSTNENKNNNGGESNDLLVDNRPNTENRSQILGNAETEG